MDGVTQGYYQDGPLPIYKLPPHGNENEKSRSLKGGGQRKGTDNGQWKRPLVPDDDPTYEDQAHVEFSIGQNIILTTEPVFSCSGRSMPEV